MGEEQLNAWGSIRGNSRASRPKATVTGPGDHGPWDLSTCPREVDLSFAYAPNVRLPPFTTYSTVNEARLPSTAPYADYFRQLSLDFVLLRLVSFPTRITLHRPHPTLPGPPIPPTSLFRL